MSTSLRQQITRAIHVPQTAMFWSVSLSHFTQDTFNAMGAVVLTFFASTALPMTNTQLGLMISISQLVGAISQPIFGLMADRSGGRRLGGLSLPWSLGFFMLAMALGASTGQYWLMFVPFVLRSLGSGAFHPVGALHAGESEPEFAASNLSIFFLLGQLGLALGPALAGAFLDFANPNPQPGMPVNISPFLIASAIALPTAWWLWRNLPSKIEFLAKKPKIKRDEKSKGKFAFPIAAFSLLIVIVLLRSLGQPGSVSFLPRLFESKGWSPTEYGLITSTYWIASGIAGVFFGQLADRFDRRHVMLASMVLSVPAFYFLPVTDGALAILLAVAAGGFSGGSHSIIVVMAQDLIPASKGFVSGAILGLIFGGGALGTLFIGFVSDQIGINSTFQWVAIAMLIAGILALFLPRTQRKIKM